MNTNMKKQSSDLGTVNKKRNINIMKTSDTMASFEDTKKRAKELSDKLSSLCNEFPETKFIIEYEKVQSQVGTAVEKYKDLLMTQVEAEKAKKRKNESVPLYSLPDEVLSKCLSYVGKGHFGLVGLTSKKLRKAYIAAFMQRTFFPWQEKSIYIGQMTSYLEMATSVKIANHCLENLCESSEERNEVIKAAAVNGNVDILRAVVKKGYRLNALVEMKKKTIYECYDGSYTDEEQRYETDEEFDNFAFEFYYTDEQEEIYDDSDYRGVVKLSQIVARGHLHVLKYLHEELNYHEGLQMYVKPAIEYGKLEILDWLHSINCMNEYDNMHQFYYDLYERNFKRTSLCDHAVRCGNVESLLWLDNHGHEHFEEWAIMRNAIGSESLEMIQYCFNEGYRFDNYGITTAITDTENVEVYRLLHNLGFDFRRRRMVDWVLDITKSFEIIEFLRSIAVPWDRYIMGRIAKHGSVEMMKYAHRDGCPWRGDEYKILMKQVYIDRFSDGEKHVKFKRFDKLEYLVGNGCAFDYEQSCDLTKQRLVEVLKSKKDLEMLEFFVGKNSSFDHVLLKYCIDQSIGGRWFEGISFVLKNGKDIVNSFRSMEELFYYYSFYEQSSDWIKDTLIEVLVRKGNVGLPRRFLNRELLEFVVGRNSSFDNELFKCFLKDESFGAVSFQGISYLLEHGKDIQRCRAIEVAFQNHCNPEQASVWIKQRVFDLLMSKKDVTLLAFFVGKDLSFDKELLKHFQQECSGQNDLWQEGVSYLLQNSKGVNRLSA